MVARRTIPNSPHKQRGFVNFNVTADTKEGFKGSIEGHNITLPKFPFTAAEVRKAVRAAALFFGGAMASTFSPNSNAHVQLPEPAGIIHVMEKAGAAASGRPSEKDACSQPTLVHGQDGQDYYVVRAERGCAVVVLPLPSPTR